MVSPLYVEGEHWVSASPSVFFYDLRMGVFSSQISYVSLILSLQVHKLEPDVWKNVEAIYIDIADRSQVLPKVW